MTLRDTAPCCIFIGPTFPAAKSPGDGVSVSTLRTRGDVCYVIQVRIEMAGLMAIKRKIMQSGMYQERGDVFVCEPNNQKLLGILSMLINVYHSAAVSYIPEDQLSNILQYVSPDLCILVGRDRS